MAIDLFTINKTLIPLINIIAVWLAAWVFLSNPKHKLNRIFIWMVFFMMLWVNFAYLARVIGESNPTLVLLCLKIAWFATPLLFVILYILVINLLNERYKYKPIDFIVILLGIATAFVVGLTDHVVKGVKFMGVFLIRLVYGDWMLPFLIVVTLLIIATLHPLIKEYYSKSSKIRGKIGYFLVGALVFYIANIIFNIVFPIIFDITRYYFLGDYSTIILLVFIAYAVVKQQLFGIKVVLSTLFLSLMAILLLSDIFVPSSFSQLFKPVTFLIFLFLGREFVLNTMKEAEQLKQAEKLAHDLKLANKKLEDLVTMKNNFLRIVSHQLRTPLTVVRGLISMWNEGDFDSYPPEKMIEVKKKIVGSAERLNNIVDDMTTAMETEGCIRLNLGEVDVAELLEKSIETVKGNYEKKNLYLKYEKPSANLPKIEADERYVSSAFMNLIDNAEKYTEKGGLEIKVTHNDKNIKVTFTDTGVGVAKEDKENLFKKFSRGKKSSLINPNGSGLGLFIAKQIIKQHGGDIVIKSKGEGRGTTFEITLPIGKSKLQNKTVVRCEG